MTDSPDPTAESFPIPRVFLPTKTHTFIPIRHKGCPQVSPIPPPSFLPHDLSPPLASLSATSPPHLVRSTSTPPRCWNPTTRSGRAGVLRTLQAQTSRSGVIQETSPSSLPTRRTPSRSSYGNRTTRGLEEDLIRFNEVVGPRRSTTHPKTIYIARIPIVESTRRRSRFLNLRRGQSVGQRRSSLPS